MNYLKNHLDISSLDFRDLKKSLAPNRHIAFSFIDGRSVNVLGFVVSSLSSSNCFFDAAEKEDAIAPEIRFQKFSEGDGLTEFRKTFAVTKQ